MNHNFLRCPQCSNEIQKDENKFICQECNSNYEIIRDIPRFVPANNYANSFGFQWNTHRKTQLDKYNGLTISKDRLFNESKWTAEEIKNANILECGSGAGRFSQVLCDHGANVYSIDYSDAVDANKVNNKEYPNLHLFQASIYDLPFKENTFDKLLCLGVIQHTPNVEDTFKTMFKYLKKGGKFCIDVYAAPHSYLHPRHLLRPFTRRMDDKKLYNIVKRVAPVLLPISTALHSVPLVGEILARTIPVANWRKNIKLKNEDMWKEWAILDTYDWLAPAYETPQTASTMKKWCEDLNLSNYKVERLRGIYVVSGVK